MKPLLAAIRFASAAVGATLLAALAIGLPTDVVPNPWFTRMTPVRDLDVVLWAANSVLLGLLVATFIGVTQSACGRGTLAGAGSGILGVLAVGCPVCNKVVVAPLGASGAVSYFQPAQPILGALGVGFALAALVYRVRLLREPFRLSPPGSRT